MKMGLRSCLQEISVMWNVQHTTWFGIYGKVVLCWCFIHCHITSLPSGLLHTYMMPADLQIAS